MADRRARASRQPRQAHLRRQPRFAGRGRAHPDTSSCMATSATGFPRPPVDEHRPCAIVNFAAESHVDRSIDGPADFIETNVVGTFRCSEPRAILGDALPPGRAIAFRFLHVSTDEVYGSLGRPAVHRDHALRAQLALLGLQGGQRSFGPRLSSHLRPADADHQLLEQLRAVPVPRKADPADHPQRARGQAAARLWRRAARPRLALRGRSLPRHSLRPGGGAPGETYNIGGDCERANLDVVDDLPTVDRLMPGLPHGPAAR